MGLGAGSVAVLEVAHSQMIPEGGILGFLVDALLQQIDGSAEGGTAVVDPRQGIGDIGRVGQLFLRDFARRSWMPTD